MRVRKKRKWVVWILIMLLCIFGTPLPWPAAAYGSQETVSSESVAVGETEEIFREGTAVQPDLPEEPETSAEIQTETENEIDVTQEQEPAEASEEEKSQTTDTETETFTDQTDEAENLEKATETKETETESETNVSDKKTIKKAAAKASDESQEPMKSTETLAAENYNLTYLIQSGYQVVSFGNATFNQHSMGGLLVEGDLYYDNAKYAIGDSEYMTKPSYVAGYVHVNKEGYNGLNNRSNQNPVPNFYVGSSNTVSSDGKTLNGVNPHQRGYNRDGIVAVNDNYIDWSKLEQKMTSLSAVLPSYSSQEVKKFGTGYGDMKDISVQAGGSINLIGYGKSLDTIKIVGSSKNFTIINILDSGEVRVPKISTYNGVSLSDSESSFEDVPILFNFPNASKVIVDADQKSEIGHILAPGADIVVTGANFNGILIGKNITVSGEGHIRNYHGDEPGPKYYTVNISKTGPDGASLAGAHLEIVDASGNQVTTFTTSEQAESLQLPAGSYRLREVEAPEGYQLAGEIAFTVDSKGNITVDGKTICGPVTMQDSYEPVETDLTAEKTLQGGSLTGEDFSFLLEPVKAGAPMPEGSENNRRTVKNDAAGQISFGSLTFTEPGSWRYRITEIAGTEENDPILYDAAIYYADITVSKGEKGLSVSKVYLDQKEKTITDIPIFKNIHLPGLSIHKVNGLEEKMTPDLYQQVRFRIVYEDKDGKQTEMKGEAEGGLWMPDAEGVISLTGLRPGLYRITEAQAPDNYMQIQDEILVEVTGEGKISLASKETSFVKLIDAQPQGNASSDSNKECEELVFMVRNCPYIIMPETGRRSSLLCSLCGMLVTATGAWLLFTSQKKNGKKENAT